MCCAKYILKTTPRNRGVCRVYRLHLRIWCNTAKPDVNTLLDNIHDCFVLRIKKEATKKRMEIVDIAEINL